MVEVEVDIIGVAKVAIDGDAWKREEIDIDVAILIRLDYISHCISLDCALSSLNLLDCFLLDCISPNNILSDYILSYCILSPQFEELLQMNMAFTEQWK
jgi:hypothetical protein